MAVLSHDPDALVRIAAFEQLRRLTAQHGGALPWNAIRDGFVVDGRQVRFASAAEGIFKPSEMSGVLSVKTVVPNPRGRIWYHDQVAADESLRVGADLMWYAFKGSDPNDVRNQWLLDAMRRRLPIVYFYGIAPGVYEPLFPAYVVEWDAARLSCALAPHAFGAATGLWTPPAEDERRYAVRAAKHRLHQAMFRQRVLAAYGGRCALSGLPEGRLLDAAHVVADADAAQAASEIVPAASSRIRPTSGVLPA